MSEWVALKHELDLFDKNTKASTNKNSSLIERKNINFTKYD